jgi:hypothetical protein
MQKKKRTYLYYNSPLRIILGLLNKTSPAESLQPLCTQKITHRNLAPSKSMANKIPRANPTGRIRCMMRDFSPASHHAPFVSSRQPSLRNQPPTTTLLPPRFDPPAPIFFSPGKKMKHPTPLRLNDTSHTPLDIRRRHLGPALATTSGSSASDGRIWFPSTSPPSSSSLYLGVHARGQHCC